MNKSEINAFMANTRELTVATVAEATALTFPNDGGDFWVRIEERGGAKFKTSDTGSGNGYDSLVIDGGYLELDEDLSEGLHLRWLGGVADWDGTTGFDNSPVLQAAIDFFGVDRGVVRLLEGAATHASAVDFKRVELVGVGRGANADSGVSYLHFQNGGLYTSIEDNRAPLHKNFITASTSVRTQNGQILIDLTGLNYPRLENILIFGGEEGLRIQDGAVVESHYGNFSSVDISRSYRGVRVLGGNRTQSHDFFGGRIWDCVEAYENAEGTSDISFYGTVFESDIAIVHTNAGANPDAASTNRFGGRDESDVSPRIECGSLHEFGTYWSGNRTPSMLDFDATTGATEKEIQFISEGLKNRINPTGRNLLRNPAFAPDVNDSTKVPGWSDTAGVPIVAVHRGAFGNVAQMRGFDATSRTLILRQNHINLRKGWYSWGMTFNSLGTTGLFTTKLTENGTALVEGVDFEGTAVDTTGGGRRLRYIKLLRDIENVRFEATVAAVNDADDVFFTEPFLIEGRSSKNQVSVHGDGVGTFYSDSIPTAGGYQAGDKVINTAPSIDGNNMVLSHWVRLTSGNAHVLGTDWAAQYVSTVSPAT